MLVDFQHHYMPAALMPTDDEPELRVDAKGAPHYRCHPLLADLPSHIRMMDAAGIDVAVLSCGAGFDQSDVGICHQINDDLHAVVQRHRNRFIGLAHVPAINIEEAVAELRRCALQLGFPGVVVASEIAGQSLDSDNLRAFWKAVTDLDLFVFIHPPPRVIEWPLMDADDLGRTLGWEFSLMVCAVRLINSGLLDQFPNLRIQFSHFAGGLGRYLPRIEGMQFRKPFYNNLLAKHCRTPARPFGAYLKDRLFYDCAGWVASGDPDSPGSAWARAGLGEIPSSQVVFGTDYPQACDADDEIVRYVAAIKELGKNTESIVSGTNALRLVPLLTQRLPTGRNTHPEENCPP